MRVTQIFKSVVQFTALLVTTTLAISLVPGFGQGFSYADTAASTTSGFSLQVSPSPLTATIEPGVTTTLELQIRNTNTQAQQLKMGLRSFTVSDTTGQVQLGSSAPSDIARFVSFSAPVFNVQAGQIYTQHIRVQTPASAGFSYSFAITVSPANPPKNTKGTALQGSIAVFTLLNVDRPGATRKLNLVSVSSSRHIYEFLPATFSIKLQNTGNSLVQPAGTLFIQRSGADAQPIATVKLNPGDGYILPGSSRTLTTTWNDGLPHYVTTTAADGSTKQSLSWSGNDLSKLRFGHYVAKVVAVYDDGQGHDMPLTAQVGFWVIPWRLLFGAIIVIGLLLVGFGTIIYRAVRRLPKPKRGGSSHA